MINKKVYRGIDIGKLIAAILVVVLHAVETNARIPAGVKYIATRFAVPFFFISSGFFFYNALIHSKNPKRYFLSYEQHLIKVLIVWELIIYLPFTIKTYTIKHYGEPLIRIIALLVRRVFIIGSGPYWYLVASFWAAAFLYLCYRSKHAVAFLAAALVIGLGLEICYSCFQNALSVFPLFQIFFKVVYVIWSWEFNFLMFGIPFMGAGWFLAKYGVEWTYKKALAFFAISTFMRFLEYNILVFIPCEFWHNNALSLAFIPQALSFFC